MKKTRRDQQARIQAYFEQSPGPYTVGQVTAGTGVHNPHMQLKRLVDQGFLMRVGHNAYMRAGSEHLLEAQDGSGEVISTTTLAYMRRSIIFIVGAIAVVINLLRQAGPHLSETARKDAEQFIVDAMAFVGSPGNIAATLPGYAEVQKRFTAYVSEGTV